MCKIYRGVAQFGRASAIPWQCAEGTTGKYVGEGMHSKTENTGSGVQIPPPLTKTHNNRFHSDAETAPRR